MIHHIGVILGIHWVCIGAMEEKMETTVWGLGRVTTVVVVVVVIITAKPEM